MAGFRAGGGAPVARRFHGMTFVVPVAVDRSALPYGVNTWSLRPSTPMPMFTLAELEAAVPLVRKVVPATPLHAWPLLARRTGAKVWVKHENHSPIGAFKI